jgi:hypothetical protein
MKKTGLIILVSLLLFATHGCNKAKWKRPTDLSFLVGLTTESALNGNLSFSGGEVLVRNISFDGERIQGDDVYFEDEFDAGALVSLSGIDANSQLLYEVPQGTYTSIRIDFDAESSASQTITILGSYLNSSSVELPVIIELDILEFSDGLARNVAGITEIELVEDIPATATILFNPAFWFETISINQLDNAQTTMVNGVESILISPDMNESIYEVVEDRAGLAAEIIIQ